MLAMPDKNLAKTYHIAFHYHFTIKKTFEMFPNIPYFIIAEDDMLYAPDFLLYFAQLAPLMERDESIMSISAYGDNGFRGLALDDNMVYRTDFFIGLGWLVRRKWFEQEWHKSWPARDWDHHMRQPHIMKDR
jgi:alpha-1,3-mannosyl-glycoprotein beta-1,2-N-acetylglucosaminyltransferase